MWKRASTKSLAQAKLSDQVIEGGSYYINNAGAGETYSAKDPGYFIWLTQGEGFTTLNAEKSTSAIIAPKADLTSYSVLINGTKIPLSTHPINSYYTTAPHNGCYECRGFSWMVYRRYGVATVLDILFYQAQRLLLKRLYIILQIITGQEVDLILIAHIIIQ